MTHAALLIPALLLDALLGEPRWLWSHLPHPAVLIGRAIGWAERRFNRGAARRLRGVALLLGLIAGAWGIGMALAALGPWAEVLGAAILLAQRSLADHVAAVAQALRLGLTDARVSVGRIVGRDTAAMDGPAVTRAAIESAAENLSDGVVAPAFWFLLGGLPGILIYKAVNTADSMIGHRTPRYEAFGWASARMDDLLNLAPARLTALILAALTGGLRHWSAIVAEARQHRSPNAGWPEAAMARALDIALSGPRAYHGQMRDYPWVYPEGDRYPGPAQIDAAVALLWRVWVVLLATSALLALLG